MREFFYSRIRSFGYAFSGWWFVIKTQRNAWIHAIASVMVIALALWLAISERDLAVLILTIGFVWAAEFFNTALEAVVDLSTPAHHPLARVGKDVGAAAVLIAALVSVVIGVLLLGPPLVAKLATLLS